ncbi:hypothetical protein [Methylobacterium sp. V23]|uniref:hypothetical protein n=1 Tax=Methylobacterium sp. V23 TaxID=2044878 RepID=UPI0015E19F89|nr:hypothetical protein [Methylobacterium sp. V23]
MIPMLGQCANLAHNFKRFLWIKALPVGACGGLSGKLSAPTTSDNRSLWMKISIAVALL